MDHIETHKADEQQTPQKPAGLTETESILFDMLYENTGVAMMDSGGSYGRAWQQNRTNPDFRNNKPMTVRESWGYVEVSLDIFHYLNERLEYDPLMQREFDKFQKSSDEYNYADMEDFAEKWHESDPDMMPKPITGNSYNEENALSQTIQFAVFKYLDVCYALIQIHGGADVRGGYTDPKAFKLGDIDDSFRLFDWCRVSGSCTCSECYTDDLSNWYDEDLFKSKQWNYSKKHDAYYCKECKSEVNFSN